jgi:hypothetical protein
MAVLCDVISAAAEIMVSGRNLPAVVRHDL